MMPRRAFGVFLALVICLATIPRSYGALNAYLTLKGSNGGKSYRCTPKADGSFTFSNVEPGTYALLVCGGQDLFSGGGGGGSSPATIEISSFSWGMSNSSTTGPGSAGSGRQAGSSSSGSSTTGVVAGDVNNDGRPDLIAKKHIGKAVTVTLSNPTQDGSVYSKVCVNDIVITSRCDATGRVAGWDMKKATK